MKCTLELSRINYSFFNKINLEYKLRRLLSDCGMLINYSCSSTCIISVNYCPISLFGLNI